MVTPRAFASRRLKKRRGVVSPASHAFTERTEAPTLRASPAWVHSLGWAESACRCARSSRILFGPDLDEDLRLCTMVPDTAHTVCNRYSMELPRCRSVSGARRVSRVWARRSGARPPAGSRSVGLEPVEALTAALRRLHARPPSGAPTVSIGGAPFSYGQRFDAAFPGLPWRRQRYPWTMAESGR
jgi:hypothetical protein